MRSCHYQDVKLLRYNAVPTTFVKYMPTAVRNLPFVVEEKPMLVESFVQPMDFRVIVLKLHQFVFFHFTVA